MAAYNWTGFYIGGNAGYGWGDAHSTSDSTVTAIGTGLNTGNDRITPSAAKQSTKLNGGLAGIQAGLNWQNGSWVYGLEADLQGAGQRGDGVFQGNGALGAIVNGVPAVGTFTQSTSYKLPWFATLRGRFGFAADRWLFYTTGGLAIAEIEASSTAILTSSPPGIGPATSSSPSVTDKAHVGWVLGVGIETVLVNNWSFKIEYLHMDFGSIAQSFATPIAATGGFANISARGNLHARFTDDIVRIGLNYKFGEPVR